MRYRKTWHYSLVIRVVTKARNHSFQLQAMEQGLAQPALQDLDLLADRCWRDMPFPGTLRTLLCRATASKPLNVLIDN